jgi:spermidine/putrescine-binding protein
MRINLIVTTVLALAGLIAAGCGGGSDGESASSGGGRSGTVVIASNGGVVQEVTQAAFATPFSQDTGTKVQYVPVGSGFTAKLQAQQQAGDISWDAIEGVDGSSAAQLWKLGLLAPISGDLARQIKPVSFPGAVTPYGVDLGDTGVIIACTKRVTRCPRTPRDFWDVARFPGRRAMVASPVEALASAAVASGVPTDAVFPLDLNRAFKKLEEIKPKVSVWTTSGDQQMQVMRNGEVDMSLMWSGRAKSLVDSGTPLRVSWDGSLIDPNYFVVIKGGPNTAAGFAYLRWYATHPAAQAQFVKKLGYSTSNKQVVGFLSRSDLAWLPSSAQNSRNQVRIDPSWYVANQIQVDQRWKDFLGS